MNLDDASREQLLEILQKREMERKRQAIADSAKEAEEEYRTGKTKPTSAQAAIDRLNELKD